MSNSANILVKQNRKDNGIYLYTHWLKDKIDFIIKSSLKKHWRWNDAPYLSRIVFDVMTYNQHDQEVNFGISEKCIYGDTWTMICDEKIVITPNNEEYNFNDFILDKKI